jgi:serine/threonine protein kinase
MLSLEEGGIVVAKIIDLGLAKAVNEAGSQTAISMPGIFAGTPEFASPEQFGGVQVDIRSDLPIGAVLRGWARSASGDADEGSSWIEQGEESLKSKTTLKKFD